MSAALWMPPESRQRPDATRSLPPHHGARYPMVVNADAQTGQVIASAAGATLVAFGITKTARVKLFFETARQVHGSESIKSTRCASFRSTTSRSTSSARGPGAAFRLSTSRRSACAVRSKCAAQRHSRQVPLLDRRVRVEPGDEGQSSTRGRIPTSSTAAWMMLSPR